MLNGDLMELFIYFDMEIGKHFINDSITEF